MSDYINHKENLKKFSRENPFGVLITSGGWTSIRAVVNFALTNYALYKAFPNIIEREHVFAGLNFLYGCHPGSNR